MKYGLIFTFAFVWLGGLISCNEESNFLSKEWKSVPEEIRRLSTVAVTRSNQDSLLHAWMELMQSPILKNDTVSAVKVDYNVARLYAMRGQDSAEFYVQRALDYIEPTEGNLEDKALVYNGMGNIRSLVANNHEANYYYNKAAAIVLSDDSIQLSAEAKSAMLLSAAQSNEMTFQYDLADKMNRAALPLIKDVPEGHINHQRVLVQMIQMLSATRAPSDSILPYLHRLEELHRNHPDRYNVSFLYESKEKYFARTTLQDSLLHYQLLKIDTDEKLYQLDSSAGIHINNLLIAYCNASHSYIVLEKVDQANKILKKATDLRSHHQKMIYPSNEIDYQNSLAALYKAQGKKDQAIAVLSYTASLQKAIYETENTQAVAEMSSLYQLQAKDRSIRTLHENIKIDKLRLQKNRLLLAVSILITVLLSMLLLFFYYTYRQRRLQQVKEKIILQQQLLRTQMEPHFIFNILAAVQSFIRMDRKEQAIKYLNRFSRLLRSSLELSRENLVPLNEEIETLENYINLQQMRFEDAFSYSLQQPFEQDLSAVMLPPMLVQPYVENAILHGVDMDKGGGHVAVEFSFEADDLLKIRIADTGKTDERASEFTHRSLSGAISRERIQLLGKQASISMTSSTNGGTVVVLCIPVVKA
ncbi:sensor histidine kinase [Sphingobacterium sp. LRF_L2]|uniref:sensor histidine kinase n=1 Tax=Sphingobacterium sp. LRF_L2 TaxID=3369421 RepID=UPI003F5EFFD5